MIDLSRLFQDDPPEKGAFLSRIFGIFNEEIIRIWAKDVNSQYAIHEQRPTLYDGNQRYTLDFLLEKDGALFVSEMKCEIQYQNYRYWRLSSHNQLKHHLSKKAFELFLQLSQDPTSVLVKAGTPIKVSGTVLVWGAATLEGIADVRNEFGITDVLTVEFCINDLVGWNNIEYRELLDLRDQWISSLLRVFEEI